MRLGFKRFDVGDSGSKQTDAILESTKSDVTVLAQQTAHGSGGMTVVNSQINGSAVALAAGWLFTDGADAVLGGEHSGIFVQSDPVTEHQIMVLLLVECRKLIGKGMVHIRKMRIGRSQFAGTRVGSGVFVAGLNMKEHAFKSESATTVLAGLEFPTTGASLDPAVISSVNALWVIFAPFVESCERAWLAFVVKAVNASSVFGKFSPQLYLLTSRAKSLFWWNIRKAFAQLSPVSAESFWGSFFTAKAAFDIGFTDHDLIVA